MRKHNREQEFLRWRKPHTNPLIPVVLVHISLKFLPITILAGTENCQNIVNPTPQPWLIVCCGAFCNMFLSQHLVQLFGTLAWCLVDHRVAPIHLLSYRRWQNIIHITRRKPRHHG